MTLTEAALSTYSSKSQEWWRDFSAGSSVIFFLDVLLCTPGLWPCQVLKCMGLFHSVLVLSGQPGRRVCRILEAIRCVPLYYSQIAPFMFSDNSFLSKVLSLLVTLIHIYVSFLEQQRLLHKALAFWTKRLSLQFPKYSGTFQRLQDYTILSVGSVAQK